MTTPTDKDKERAREMIEQSSIPAIYGLAKCGYGEIVELFAASLADERARADAANKLARLSRDNELRWMRLCDLLHVAACQAAASNPYRIQQRGRSGSSASNRCRVGSRP